MLRSLLSSLVLMPLLVAAAGPPAGFLIKDGQAHFPIGLYETPKDDAAAQELAAAGINLFLCRDRADLDRVAKVGAKGWVPVPMQAGADDAGFRKLVESVKGHPALAAWEGPDEIIWNFTAYSGLFLNKTYSMKDEWWHQTPFVLDFSEKKAAEAMPKLASAAKFIRDTDPDHHPIWINEAARSDLKFLRQYIDHIDITGCDDYPVHDTWRKPMSVANYTDRFKKAGYGKPVWMVLQAFSWGKLADRHEAIAYPTFTETRAMAWASVTHGAHAVLYWGMAAAPPEPAFRQSIFAMTAELAAAQPFLTSANVPGAKVEVIDSEDFDVPSRGVTSIIRRSGKELFIVLVNEDNRGHYGVVVNGLGEVKQLEELYSSRSTAVKRGEFVTRLLPYEVKIFSTSRRYESKRTEGRDYVYKP